MRAWRSTDAEALFDICNREEVMRYISAPWSMLRVQRFIEEEQERARVDGHCYWAFVHRASSRLMGFCGLRGADELEIGWRLHPDYWGKGLATEGAMALLDEVRALVHPPRVFAHIHVLNAASIALAERIGLTRMGTIPVAEYEDYLYELVV